MYAMRVDGSCWICLRCGQRAELGGCLLEQYPCCRACEFGPPVKKAEAPKAGEVWTSIALGQSQAEFLAKSCDGEGRTLDPWNFWLWNSKRMPSCDLRFEVEGEGFDDWGGVIFVPAGTRVRAVVEEDEWFVGCLAKTWFDHNAVGNYIKNLHDTLSYWYAQSWNDKSHAGRNDVVKFRVRRADCRAIQPTDNGYQAVIYRDRDTYFERLP